MAHPHHDPRRRRIPFKEWPVEDQRAWMNALAPGSVLEEGGTAAHWAPQTRRKRREAYGRWLNFLDRNDRWNSDRHPPDRVTRERVRDYIMELQKTVSSYTVLIYIEDLYAVMKVTSPSRDWTWLRKTANRLQVAAVSQRDKNTRLRPSADLYTLGIQLMNDTETATGRPILNRATRYRDGLIIALLAARPIRRRNLGRIIIGQNLIKTSDCYWLHFEASETKTLCPIDVPLPATLTPFMDKYLDHHRRVLLRDGKCRNLWVLKNRTAMAEQSLYTAVRARTKEAFGKPINLHMFRDAAATSIAIEDPDHVRIAPTLLGHSSLATTQKYYDQSRMLAAGRNYQSTLNQLRNKLRTEMRGPHKINTGARSNRKSP